MEEKVIAWNKGSGNITLRYEGSGTSDITIESDANDLTEEREQTVVISSVEFPSLSVNLLVRQEALSIPQYDFNYTGSVQQITLPAGWYKLECWGAQGADYSNYAGSPGGYSVGIIVLEETTTLYIFVGGKPKKYNGNGGWNCGGASSGSSNYGTGSGSTRDYGSSYFGAGGGATDICTVKSTMSYPDTSGSVNARTSKSLLSRFIVAGGGAGAYKIEYMYHSNTTNYVYSDEQEYGGGKVGGGYYGGTQSSAQGGGSFGFGASQLNTGRRIVYGAGGGGWYGGGTGYRTSASAATRTPYCGGGSGFVNIPINSSYRPSGYTGLELNSGKTYGGDKTFLSPYGENETGHTGNGYARITKVKEGEVIEGGEGVEFSAVWEPQSGTWTEESYSEAADGKKLSTSISSSKASNIIRCAFSGVTSITFSYTYDSTYVSACYLTIGEIDKACTNTSYGTKVTTTGTKTITFNPSDNKEHYVEFCLYSNNSFISGSVSLYIQSYEQ